MLFFVKEHLCLIKLYEQLPFQILFNCIDLNLLLPEYKILIFLSL